MAPPLSDPVADRPPSQATGLVPYHAEIVIAAPIERVWRAFTTKAGLEGWWGAEDVRTKVERLELRPGGALQILYVYAATASDPRPRRAFEGAGLPTEYRARGSYLEVDPPRRLESRQFLEFGPGAPALELRVSTELRQLEPGTRVLLTAASVPTSHWTALGRANLEGQLARLVSYLARDGPPPAPSWGPFRPDGPPTDPKTPPDDPRDRPRVAQVVEEGADVTSGSASPAATRIFAVSGGSERTSSLRISTVSCPIASGRPSLSTRT